MVNTYRNSISHNKEEHKGFRYERDLLLIKFKVGYLNQTLC